jgi:hypothetical protein
LLRDFRQGGAKAIERVRRLHPAAYMKICALLVPREMKIEQTNRITGLSDEQLDAMIAHLEESIARRAAGSDAKLIDGTVEATAGEATTLPVLEPPRRRPNRLMMEADTAVGPRERRPRKSKVPSSG